jgi:RHH-type proline utilization regulon transcriptional repressor/proline dehydrogenase/delta 1-pyrroline-5-carboxylate dehydrogenase
MVAPDDGALSGPLAALRDWAVAQAKPLLAAACESAFRRSPSQLTCTLTGPTGERNVYSTLPRGRVLCLASDEDDLLVQLAGVCAVGSRAAWPTECQALLQRLPQAVREHVSLLEDWTHPSSEFDAACYSGPREGLIAVMRKLAERPGPIVGVTVLPPGSQAMPLERLVIERSLSVNTAAAGGNASLMTIG